MYVCLCSKFVAVSQRSCCGSSGSSSSSSCSEEEEGSIRANCCLITYKLHDDKRWHGGICKEGVRGKMCFAREYKLSYTYFCFPVGVFVLLLHSPFFFLFCHLPTPWRLALTVHSSGLRSGRPTDRTGTDRPTTDMRAAMLFMCVKECACVVLMCRAHGWGKCLCKAHESIAYMYIQERTMYTYHNEFMRNDMLSLLGAFSLG